MELWPGRGTDLQKTSTDGARRAGGKGKKAVKAKKPAQNPGWASGLRQLYDSVVDEPLPDSFNDLLSKLDRKS
jgi:hypothetical protein